MSARSKTLIMTATLVAAAESLIRIGDRIVCLTGIDGSGTIDTVMVLDMGTEIEMFADTAADPLPADVTPAVFERLLTIAGELGLEGREGRPVGKRLWIGAGCDRKRLPVEEVEHRRAQTAP